MFWVKITQYSRFRKNREFYTHDFKCVSNWTGLSVARVSSITMQQFLNISEVGSLTFYTFYELPEPVSGKGHIN